MIAQNIVKPKRSILCAAAICIVSGARHNVLRGPLFTHYNMPTHPQPTNPERIARLLTMASILIVVCVLFVAREVLVPLALAMLFSFLLAPVVTRLERWRFGRIPAVLATVFLAFCVVAGVGYLVFGQLYDLTIELPKYKNNISAKIA